MEAAANMDVQPPAVPSWDDVRGIDLDAVFATHYTSDRCLDALARAQQDFPRDFPGWPLWRRLLIGDALLDRTLEAYAILLARRLARDVENGKPFVAARARRADWIAQAGRDGLDFALFRKYAAGGDVRAAQFRVGNVPYRRVRDGVARMLFVGVELYACEAKRQWWKYFR